MVLELVIALLFNLLVWALLRDVFGLIAELLSLELCRLPLPKIPD